MAECSFIDYHLQSSGVVVLTLDNPPLNLTTLVTLDKLLSACRDIAADQRIRAVVVTGSGSKAFCAGSDIGEFTDVRGMSCPVNWPAKTPPSPRSSNYPYLLLRD
jgi:enoyl-CoA hydratase